jgi:hypothetical protein
LIVFPGKRKIQPSSSQMLMSREKKNNKKDKILTRVLFHNGPLVLAVLLLVQKYLVIT